MTEKHQGPGHDLSLVAEETLRLVAQLPPPADLTDRLHARIHARIQQELAELPARRSFWPLWLRWMPARRLKFAGAAVLALAVGVSAWTVSHAHRGNQGTAPVVNGSANGTGPGAFGSADAKRVPPSLKPILVPEKPGAKRKPTASKVKPVPRPAASQTSDADSKP
jgi:hypothetical protein